MADAAQQPFSFNMEEVTRLHNIMHTPGNPKGVAEAENRLRLIQRSPQGWELADALLSRSDDNLRFFGALTFTIKLNNDSAGLTEEDVRQLLNKLIQHLLSQPTSTPASRKLCSTLSKYFYKPFSTWTQCIRSLAVSFALQRPVLDDGLEGQPSTWDILPPASAGQLLALLQFASELAQDGTKFINTPNYDRKIPERLLSNIEALEVLLQVSFGRAFEYLSRPGETPENAQLIQLGEKLAEEALRCFSLWVAYAMEEFPNLPEKVRYLRSVTELALGCLEFHIDGAMGFVSTVFEMYAHFFEAKHRDMLWAAITGPWGMGILQNLDAETVKLASIIVAYGDALLGAKRLYQEPDDPHHREVMSVLHELLKYPEAVGMSEDDTAPVALEFWSNYVSDMSDELLEYTEEDTKPAWMETATNHVFLLILELVQKIIYPPPATFKAWDEDAKKTFTVFRCDFKDIIEEAFNILHAPLLSRLVDFTVRAFETNEWLELEAGLFCLTSLSDHLREPEDVQLQRLFELPLFTVMSSNSNIPAVVRRGVVDMIAAFDDFFLRHADYLPQVLTFLFSALAQPSLANLAAKSFAALCSRCRTSLTGELASFFQMYQQFLSYPTANETTKSRVLEGIAAIVQALGSQGQRLAGIQQLFQYVAHDAMEAVNAAKQDPEQGLVLTLTTLKCLSSIGKSMQASDETVIDLEASKQTPSDYWTQGPGKVAQSQIINFVSYLTGIFSRDGEVIEAGCDVLRAGFKESVPGPFVLPPYAAISYVLKTDLNTPRLPYVLETASCWISAYKDDKSGDYEKQCEQLVHHVFTLLQALQHPRNDPEIAVGCIDLIKKFVNKDARIFSIEDPEVLEGMFQFSIECIRAPDVLPKRASAELWRDIFSLCAATKSPYQGIAQNIVQHFGPAVTSALMYNLCGEVDQSSLEHILVPVRRLINVDRNARTYITNALARQPLLIQAKDDAELAGVVQRLIESLMRNAASYTAFRQVVKEFWQRCKAMHVQYNVRMHPAHRFAHGAAPTPAF